MYLSNVRKLTTKPDLTFSLKVNHPHHDHHGNIHTRINGFASIENTVCILESGISKVQYDCESVPQY